MKTNLFVSAFSVALLLLTASSHAVESWQRGTGLEAAGAIAIPVLIEHVSPDAQKRGLTRERVEARANSILRKSGLKPFDDPRATSDFYLYIQVSVVGPAFSVSLSFCRFVSYADGDTPYRTIGRVWTRETTGVASSGTEYILEAVGDLAEVFSNAYLKANSK